MHDRRHQVRRRRRQHVDLDQQISNQRDQKGDLARQRRVAAFDGVGEALLGRFFCLVVVAVVGGGDAAVEEADYLTRYADKVYLVHRREELRASKILQERAFANPKIEFIWNTVVERAAGDDQGLLHHLELRDVNTQVRRDLHATGLFIFVGFNPNTGVIADHVDHDEFGYLRTDWSMQTSVPGLFAAGDVRVQITRQVTTAVGDATTAAIAAEKFLKARADAAKEVGAA